MKPLPFSAMLFIALSQGNLKPVEPMKFGDVYSLGGRDSQQLLLSFLPKDKDAEATPFVLYNIDKSLKVKKARYQAPATFHHLRNISSLDIGAGRKLLFVADHGTDAPPWVGGHSRLYVVSQKGPLREIALEKNPAKAFTFSGALGKSTGPDHGYWLYLSNIGRDSPRIFHIDRKFKNVMERSDLLPQEIKQLQKTYLSSLWFSKSFPDSSAEQLFLGGDGAAKKFPKDALFDFGKEEFIKRMVLPDRKPKATWSTVEAISLDANGDKRTDLLLLTHDDGFRTGEADLLLGTKDGGFERVLLPLPSLESRETWIVRAIPCDIDNDKKMDLFFILRASTQRKENPDLEKVIFLHNTGDAKFTREELSFLRENKDYFVGGACLKQKNKSVLFLMNYQGDFTFWGQQ